TCACFIICSILNPPGNFISPPLEKSLCHPSKIGVICVICGTQTRPHSQRAHQSLLRSATRRVISLAAIDCFAWLRRQQAADDARSAAAGSRRLCDCFVAGFSPAYQGAARAWWSIALRLWLVNKLSQRRVSRNSSPGAARLDQYPD